MADEALAASSRGALAHYAKAQVLRAHRRYHEAIPEYETVIALDRNWVAAFHHLGQCKLYTGSIDQTIPLTERAIQLSPRDPELGLWYRQIGLVHLLQSRTDEALFWFERARNYGSAYSVIHASLASCYALNDEAERAAAELAEARRLSGDDRFLSIAKLKASQYWGVPFIRALFEATFFRGLHQAGVSEE